MTDTLTKLEHPAVAALRDLAFAVCGFFGADKNGSGIPADLRDEYKRANKALAASAAYDEAVGECVAALRDCASELTALEHGSTGGVPNTICALIPERVERAESALAKIAKLGVR